MSKLITNPHECGYCDIENNYRDTECKHPKKKGAIVCVGQDFPVFCPLPEGMTEEQFKEQQKPKKRNRKDCVSYNSGLVSSNNCNDERFWIRGSMVYPKCKGVNCGSFKTE